MLHNIVLFDVQLCAGSYGSRVEVGAGALLRSVQFLVCVLLHACDTCTATYVHKLWGSKVMAQRPLISLKGAASCLGMAVALNALNSAPVLGHLVTLATAQWLTAALAALFDSRAACIW